MMVSISISKNWFFTAFITFITGTAMIFAIKNGASVERSVMPIYEK